MLVIACALVGGFHIGATEKLHSGYVQPEDSVLKQSIATLLLTTNPTLSQTNGAGQTKLRWTEKLATISNWRSRTDDFSYKVASKKDSVTDVLTEIVTEECQSGDDEACNVLNAEEAAKREWLANLDQGRERFSRRSNQVLTKIVTEECQSGDDEACNAVAAKEPAKRFWLANLLQRRNRFRREANQVSAKTLTEDCESGFHEACQALSAQKEAKQIWPAVLDRPLNRKTAQKEAKQILPAVLDRPLNRKTAQEEAKQKWFAKFEGHLNPKWRAWLARDDVFNKLAVEECRNGDAAACQFVAKDGRRNDMLGKLGLGSQSGAVPGRDDKSRFAPPHYTMRGKTRSNR